MKVTINQKKKEIKLVAGSMEEKAAFKLIAAISNPEAVKFPKQNKSLMSKLLNWASPVLILDMKHEGISKEFIQMMLRVS